MNTLTIDIMTTILSYLPEIHAARPSCSSKSMYEAYKIAKKKRLFTETPLSAVHSRITKCGWKIYNTLKTRPEKDFCDSVRNVINKNPVHMRERGANTTMQELSVMNTEKPFREWVPEFNIWVLTPDTQFQRTTDGLFIVNDHSILHIIALYYIALQCAQKPARKRLRSHDTVANIELPKLHNFMIRMFTFICKSNKYMGVHMEIQGERKVIQLM